MLQGSGRTGLLGAGPAHGPLAATVSTTSAPAPPPARARRARHRSSDKKTSSTPSSPKASERSCPLGSSAAVAQASRLCSVVIASGFVGCGSERRSPIFALLGRCFWSLCWHLRHFFHFPHFYLSLGSIKPIFYVLFRRACHLPLPKGILSTFPVHLFRNDSF